MNDLAAPIGAQNSSRTGRVCLLVLGMHRSGTSALTQVLSLLGATAPQVQVPAHPTNPTGHWEPRRLVLLNDELLAELGSSWTDWRQLDFAFLPPERFQHYRDRIHDIIAEDYGDSPFFVLKDPRICRLVPVYRAAIEQVGARVCPVISLRNPLSVAASLETRDGLSIAASQLSWLRHIIDAERDTRDMDRAIVAFDDLLTDWQATATTIAAKLGLTWPLPPEDVAPQIEAILSHDLVHHAESAEELAENQRVTAWVKEAYAAVLEMRTSPAAGHLKLDKVARAADAYLKEAAADPEAAILKSIEAGQLPALTKRVAELEQINTALRRAARSANSARQNIETELSVIKKSRSWRYTEMIRKANSLRHLPRRTAAQIVLRKAKSVVLGRRSVPTPAINEIGCLVVTPPHTAHLANLYAAELRDAGFTVDVSNSPEAQDAYQHLFVFCPNVFDNLRPGYIAIQMEQTVSSRWFNDGYLEKLEQASAIIDYSIDNIAFLRDLGFPLNKLFHVPVGPAENTPKKLLPLEARPIDVLFYGDIHCARRKALIDALSAEFNIRVESNLFGPELHEMLGQSKVVLNVHYYEDALLETTRLCECISLGTPIVSESSADEDQMRLFESAVAFAPVGSAVALADALRSAISPRGWSALSAGAKQVRSDRHFWFKRQLRRALYAMDLIGLRDLSAVAIPSVPATPRICLTLAETPVRTRAFNHYPQAGEFEKFDGIRHKQGWIGCGLSYQMIMQAADERGWDQLVVCEDDVLFPDDFDARNAVVDRYLKQHRGEWDLFSGFMADIAADTKISKVEEVDGVKFVWLDRCVSMVYNVYAKSAIEELSRWSHINDNVNTNTIDRYLQSKRIRVVTAYPYLVGHAGELYSTIWGFKNTQYNSLVTRSEIVMSELLDRATA